MTRAGRLSIALSALAIASAAVGTASADVGINVPGGSVTVPTPPVEVPLPGGGKVGVRAPDVDIDLPAKRGRPPVSIGQGNGQPPVTVDPGNGGPPAQTPPAPTPPAGTPAPKTSTPPPAASNQATPSANAQTAATQTAATPTNTTAATSAPATQSHTVPAISRSGSAPRPRRAAPRRVAPRRTTPVATPVAAPAPRPRREATPSPDPAPAKKQRTEPRRASAFAATIDDVVHLLPGWVLAIFLGFAALAAGMAVNAYLSNRRARRLAAQRAELVDDVGHLQAALLAPVPSTPDDVAFSVAYRPAAGLAAGGDFYDVFELDADRTAMLLGDVSGHGRESVAHAALVRYTLRTFIAAGHGPAEAIALTDPCLDGHMDDQFATVIAAVYDHSSHTLTYAKAGHYPPLLLGVDDEDSLASSSPPIGAGLGARPSDTTIDVAAGATVCFFTDGVVEARRSGAPLGADRVGRLLADAPADAEALIAAVAGEADTLNDDLAVCLLHRRAEVDEPSFEPPDGERSALRVGVLAPS